MRRCSRCWMPPIDGCPRAGPDAFASGPRADTQSRASHGAGMVADGEGGAANRLTDVEQAASCGGCPG
jgi:hypothetical protein